MDNGFFNHHICGHDGFGRSSAIGGLRSKPINQRCQSPEKDGHGQRFADQACGADCNLGHRDVEKRRKLFCSVVSISIALCTVAGVGVTGVVHHGPELAISNSAAGKLHRGGNHAVTGKYARSCVIRAVIDNKRHVFLPGCFDPCCCGGGAKPGGGGDAHGYPS